MNSPDCSGPKPGAVPGHVLGGGTGDHLLPEPLPAPYGETAEALTDIVRHLENRVVHDTECSNEKNDGVGRSLLDGIVRDGARQMLAAALRAEAAAYIDTHADDVDDTSRRRCRLAGYRRCARSCGRSAWRYSAGSVPARSWI